MFQNLMVFFSEARSEFNKISWPTQDEIKGSTAVVCIGLVTGVCMFLGDAILVPVTEVGSVASAAGWLAACAAYLALTPSRRGTFIAWFGVLVAASMILMKVLPAVPGHFTSYEWLALGVWVGLGIGLAWRAPGVRMIAETRMEN